MLENKEKEKIRPLEIRNGKSFGDKNLKQLNTCQVKDQKTISKTKKMKIIKS